MSCVFVIAPVVAAGMPLLAAAVAGAAAGMGYTVRRNAEQLATQLAATETATTVEVVVPNSQVVADSLQVCGSVTIERDGVSVRFYRDATGSLTAHVQGENRSTAELKELGGQLVQRVVQQYAYHKTMAEMERRGFEVVRQEVDESQTIRVRVRRWQ